jgi:hypothetical protein
MYTYNGPIFNVRLGAPSVPAISSSNINPSGFTINWTGADGASSYTYFITPNEGTAVGSPNGSFGSVTWTGLRSGTGYTVYVTAKNDGLNLSTNSSNLSVFTFSSSPYQPMLTSSNITNAGFTVNWTGATGVSSYSYAISPNAGSYVAAPNGTSGSVTWSGVPTGTDYTVVITATNSLGSRSSRTFL